VSFGRHLPRSAPAPVSFRLTPTHPPSPRLPYDLAFESEKKKKQMPPTARAHENKGRHKSLYFSTTTATLSTIGDWNLSRKSGVFCLLRWRPRLRLAGHIGTTSLSWEGMMEREKMQEMFLIHFAPFFPKKVKG
jgi:hypothetical protein